VMLVDRNVLVTGGAGFIGSHLVERLVALGASVTALDHAPRVGLRNLEAVRDRIQYVDIDLVDARPVDLLTGVRPDFIFHLAAGAQVEASIEDPRRDLDRNAVATLNLLEAVRKASPESVIVYTSSAVVYTGGERQPIKEEDPTGPTTPYGVSKLAAECYVSVYARIYRLRSAVLRLFSVYGPRLRKQIVFDLMRKLQANANSLVLQGDGTESRDLTFVADVVEALLTVAKRGALVGEAYNVATGRQVATRDIAECLARAMKHKPQIEFSGTSNAGDTKFWSADTAKLSSLGYAPSIDLEEGVRRTVAWFHSEAAQLTATDATSGSRKPK